MEPKQIIRNIPVLGALVARIYRTLVPAIPPTTVQYWQQRYQGGGTSGAGSEGRLAEFKAKFLNGFVERNAVPSVVELGCGDGRQLSLARYPKYLGIDVSPSAIEQCRKAFGTDPTKEFVCSEAVPLGVRMDTGLSLDVIYHLVEDETFDAYMNGLFAASGRLVVVYSSDHDEQRAAWSHIRHRKFTTWVDAKAPEWSLEQVVENPYPWNPAAQDSTSFCNFYVFRRR